MMLLRSLALLCLLAPFTSYSQNLFSEDFGTGCNQGTLATTLVGWTVTNTGTNEASSNIWYISAMENNSGEGNCGEVCGNNPTLHIGNPLVLGIAADQGAAYYEGLAGFCGLLPCGSTSKRVESPVIDCSGHTAVNLSFLYLEGGNTIDNATVWYYDGSTWSQIDDPAKTFSATCSPQGQWTARTIALPASADNNPNVRIGFQWINNDNGDATDPSFAVDDILVTGTPDSGTGTCLGDFNEDGVINAADLLLFLGNFGCTVDCPYQMNGDGIVDVNDLLDFLGVIGTSCPE